MSTLLKLDSHAYCNTLHIGMYVCPVNRLFWKACHASGGLHKVYIQSTYWNVYALHNRAQSHGGKAFDVHMYMDMDLPRLCGFKSPSMGWEVWFRWTCGAQYSWKERERERKCRDLYWNWRIYQIFKKSTMDLLSELNFPPFPTPPSTFQDL